MSISLYQQMSKCKELMHSLIYEKPTTTTKIKSQKEEALSKLAKEKFIINGDEEFKTGVNNCINEILAVKPGRKLIKAIVKHNPEQKIPITLGQQSAFDEKVFKITLSLRPEKYWTLGERNFTRPAFVTLAHELIHTLHFLKNPDNFYIRTCIEDETIVEMDDLEEQRTIAGFDNRMFSKEGIESKLDVLCENTFLLALGLPFRVNHWNADNGSICEDLDTNTKQILDPYFKWLESAVSGISPIPIERESDKDFFMRYIPKNPSAAPTLPEKLKNDEEFMYELIRKDKRLLGQFPELSKNKEFMLNLIRYYELAILKLDPSLLNEKEYLIKCLNLLADDDVNKNLFAIIYKKIEEPLRGDPDIKKYFDLQ